MHDPYGIRNLNYGSSIMQLVFTVELRTMKEDVWYKEATITLGKNYNITLKIYLFAITNSLKPKTAGWKPLQSLDPTANAFRLRFTQYSEKNKFSMDCTSWQNTYKEEIIKKGLFSYNDKA